MSSLLVRRTLPLVLAAGMLVPFAAPRVHAKSGDTDAGSGTGAPIDVNFFYDTLKDDGTWYNTADYGDVWQPHIAYKSDTWRPYTDGYWSYTDGGWMFVSNEDFGWAVYHYGRWTRLKDIGWAWVPGTDWAPAWVTWRASKPDGNGPPAAPGGAAPDTATVAATSTAAVDAASPSVTTPDDKNPVPPDQSAPPAPAAEGPPPSGDYVGWAPLPPERAAYTAIDYNYGPTVDVDFGIEPYDYCFTDVRYFGAPFVATVLFDPFQSYYCCDRSVNITNIYYNHDGRYRGFYAGGPDYNRFHGVTQREIPRYTLRPTGGAAAREAIRNGQFNRVRGDTIGVPAPRFSPKGVGPDGRVRMTRAGTLAKAEVSHGAPAAAAANPAYKRASESFAKQNETYRTAHPDAPVSRASMPRAEGSGGAVPETASKITTTGRAQEEERAARRAAGEQVPESGKPAAAASPEARSEGGGPRTAAEPSAKETRRSQREGRREAARESENRESAGAEARQAAREERTSAREERQERHRAAESGGHLREGSGPRVQQQRPAPQVMAAPRPQGGGGGGGEKQQGDKKKN